MASRKSSKKKRGKRSEVSGATSPLTKTAFVRGFSHDTPAAEIVAKAKARGVTLTLSQVYDARSAIKKAELRAAKKSRPSAAPTTRKGEKAASAKPSRKVEEAFLAAAFELGRAHAQRLLNEFAREAREIRGAKG